MVFLPVLQAALSKSVELNDHVQVGDGTPWKPRTPCQWLPLALADAEPQSRATRWQHVHVGWSGGVAAHYCWWGACMRHGSFMLILSVETLHGLWMLNGIILSTATRTTFQKPLPGWLASQTLKILRRPAQRTPQVGCQCRRNQGDRCTRFECIALACWRFRIQDFIAI